MLTKQSRSSWADVLLDLANGRVIAGDRLLALPGFEPSSDVQSDGRYVITDDQGFEVLLTAAGWATEDAWVDLAVELQERACVAIVEGRPLPERLRWFAWRLGAQADFAARLSEAAI